ncbi:MAG: hypothetical protein IM509_19035 [Microcystis sp. M31BS1]|uniref:hypothetical protein n=1 Tax=Microcystis sp. M31BS1 TaxID=2771186 RepID=UPI00258959B7|nr:hypothetical protein [Microcystis sp. M31BS1]MCA2592746.1 hypothetical protein [Microcystis sp. M31BS1]
MLSIFSTSVHLLCPKFSPVGRNQLSVISEQLSVISYQLSVIREWGNGGIQAIP